MPAYVIANVHITDPIRYEDYRKLVPASLERFGGKFVIRGGTPEILEGSWQPGRLVVLEFPSVEQARAWWNSPEYAKARALRQATSDGTLLIMQGV